MREGNDDNDDDAGDDGDYGYDNDKAGETGDKNNADDYGTHPAGVKTKSKALSQSGQPRVAKSVLFPKPNLPTTSRNLTGARKGWPERAIRCITR